MKTVEDICDTVEYIAALHAGITELNKTRGKTVVEIDDIDHFGNRRLRTVGELIQNQIRTGLSRMERVVRERMTTQDVEAITPQTLINIRPVVASIKEFFGTSQLSQFMDQTCRGDTSMKSTSSGRTKSTSPPLRRTKTRSSEKVPSAAKAAFA